MGADEADSRSLIETFQMLVRAVPREEEAVVGLGTTDRASGPLVSVVIPTFNRVEFTARCLQALSENTPPELYEVVIVDNASTDGTADLLSALEGDVTVIRNDTNLGFARACNQGASAASGRYLLFLNNDTEPFRGWLEPLVALAEAEGEIGAVGSRLLFPDGTLQHAGVDIVDDRRHGGAAVAGMHRHYRRPGDYLAALDRVDVQVVTGAVMLVRRSAFAEVDGFDEGYWNGYEDIDLCLSLRDAGWRVVYEPASILLHHESVSGPERFAKVDANVERLVTRWKGRVLPDLIIESDGTVRALTGRPRTALVPG
jgi:GT2 family glycosyltransferase